MKDLMGGSINSADFQVSISSLTLGTLYEAVLAFSGQERLETLWPSVCQNARWLIPSRRMGILLHGVEGNFRIVGMFGNGKFHRPASDPEFTAQTTELKRLLSKQTAHWVQKPWERFGDESGEFTHWLLQDHPEMLFVLPIRVKEKIIGTLCFAMTSIAELDRAMLNTLGTIYALHVGMAYTLLQITDERREMENQLVMQERMAALGGLVAGIAHEINSPIGAVQSATDVVARCVATIEKFADKRALQEMHEDQRCQKAFMVLKESTEVIAAAGERISKIVSSLKNFSRLDAAEYESASLHERIDSALTLLESEFEDRITVIKDYHEIPRIDCSPGQINQVFMSLLKNASEAVEGKGTILIRTRRHGSFVHIQISDSGRGISPDRLKRIFNFDFSRTGSRVKMGSGLVTAYKIIQRHNGDIKAESTLGEGSRFTITLPIADTSDRAAPLHQI